ncbi:MAG: choice-of-anchor Q domain-containing protein [Myxococcota bacterium]|nr:choice-of-anchor Q domain-containing protein [Myxococcota bacterium]
MSCQGGIYLNGGLESSAALQIESSQLSDGGVVVEGGMNSDSVLEITSSEIAQTSVALKVGGVIIADASISLRESSLNGKVQLGAPAIAAAPGEGQYFLGGEQLSWDEAIAACESYGARLADIRNLSEANLLTHFAQQSLGGMMWTAGQLEDSPCTAGANLVEVGDALCSWTDRGFPTQISTRSRPSDCQLCNYDVPPTPECVTTSATTEGCSPQYARVNCREVTSRLARIPTCDDENAAPCYGSEATWSWAAGGDFDGELSLWGESEADQLRCFSGDNRFNDALAIAVDGQSNEGSADGRFGLWRARAQSERYDYLCEGQLALPEAGATSRGTLTIEQVTHRGDLSARLGALTITGGDFEGVHSYTLTRDATISEADFVGLFTIGSRGDVTINRSHFSADPMFGGGVNLEARSSMVYSVEIDGGLYGLSLRGAGRVENTLITRSEQIGLRIAPEGGPSGGGEVLILNNTLVDNPIGTTIQGSVNATDLTFANNLLVRGDIGVSLSGGMSVISSHNNIFGYQTRYQGLTADAGAIALNPVFVQDFETPQAEAPNFRLDNGSPLVDQGDCSLAVPLDVDGIPRPFNVNAAIEPGCDIGAYEFGPSHVYISSDRPPMTGTEVTLSLIGVRNEAEFVLSPVLWVVDPAAGIVEQESGRFRPTATPGAYPEAIRAQFGSFSATMDLDLDCGCPSPAGAPGSGCNGVPDCYFEDWDCQVRENYCQPNDAGLFGEPILTSVEEQVQLYPGARDIYGFVFESAEAFTVSVDADAGSVSGDLLFTAGQNAGSFEDAFSVDGATISGRSTAIISSGVASRIVITPQVAAAGTKRRVRYDAVVQDVFGNPVPGAEVTWELATAVASIEQDGTVTAGCEAGFFSQVVIARFEEIEARADLTINEGGAPITAVVIEPPSITIAATTSRRFEAFMVDECQRRTPAPDPVFTARNEVGSVNAVGDFTASCLRGFHTDAVTVEASGFQARALVETIDAPLAAVRIEPSQVEIKADESKNFAALGEDACGRVEPIDPIWTIPSIDNASHDAGPEGNFPASQRRVNGNCAPVGLYPQGLAARVGDFVGYAAIEVLPGLTSDLGIEIPASATLSIPAGNEAQLVARAEDSCGNNVSERVEWSTAFGEVSAAGVYRAGCERGFYSGAVIATSDALRAPIDVTITDGELQRVEIDPDPVTVPAGSVRNMQARLYDGCDNLVDGEVSWSLLNDAAGTIAEDGLFTAGTVAESFERILVASSGDFQAQGSIEIVPATIDQLEIVPSELRLQAGAAQQLSVIASDRFGNLFTPSPTWSVPDASAGSISAGGNFTAGREAEFYQDAVFASFGGVSTSLDVEVIPAEVASISVQPSPLSFTAGQPAVQLEATLSDRFGNEVVNGPVVWEVIGAEGSITPEGRFTPGTRAGVYPNLLRVRSGEVSSLVTVQIVPDAPNTLQIQPEQLILSPREAVQITAQVADQFGNLIDSEAFWSIEAGGAQISPEGLLRAGDVAGFYADTLLVRSAGLSLLTDVMINPGEPELVVISPELLRFGPGETVNLSASFQDAFGNSIPVEHEFAIGEGGEITPEGQLTTGQIAGRFENTIVVRGAGLSESATLTVDPGPVVRMRIDPELISTVVERDEQLDFYFEDRFGNRIEREDETVNWEIDDPDSDLQIGQDGRLTVSCEVSPGLYSGVVVATLQGVGLDLPAARADVQVRADETAFIQISPNPAEIEVAGQLQLFVNTLDQCANDSGQVVSWSILEGLGEIGPNGIFTASTTAGDVRVAGVVGDVSGQITVRVRPATPIQLELIPDTIDLEVNSRFDFQAQATDRFGNVWTLPNAAWSVTDEALGAFGNPGELIAGETAGRYRRGIRAAFVDRNGVEGVAAFADVQLLPGPPHRLELTPQDPMVLANNSVDFSTRVFDEFDNERLNEPLEYDCAPEVGVCTAQGSLTVGSEIGEFTDAVSVTLGDLSESTDVFVVPGDPAEVIINPGESEAIVGSVLDLNAVVLDATGVEISDLSVQWELVDPALGTINGSGVLQVGLNPGRYLGGVIASVEGPAGRIEGVASVIVPDDNDQDGILDVVELEAGLDPNDPLDAEADLDEDGLNNRQEINEGLDPRDGDSDDDGIGDGDEANWNTDADGDGLVNALDPDSDDDGLFDGTEVGNTQPHPDTDSSNGNFQPDLDPTSTTDPLDPDSDDDGLPDGFQVIQDGSDSIQRGEDLNRNGRLDPGETPADRDFPYIHCDPFLEEDLNGCPEELVCEENICIEPRREPPAAESDSGCSAKGMPRGIFLIIALLPLFGLRRRREAGHRG